MGIKLPKGNICYYNSYLEFSGNKNNIELVYHFYDLKNFTRPKVIPIILLNYSIFELESLLNKAGSHVQSSV